MKLCTLLCVTLLTLAANAQTKEAEFKKLDELLKRSEGFSSESYRIVEQALKEKSIKQTIRFDGKASTAVYSNINWENFWFHISKDEDDEQVSAVRLEFKEEIEEKLGSEKGKTKALFLYIKTADTRLLDQQLKTLQTYTSVYLNEVRMADKAQLVSYLTEKLNKALVGEKGKINNIADCGISFSKGQQTFLLPTYNLTITETDEGWAFGYENGKASITIKESGVTKNQQVKQVAVNLDFDAEPWFIEPVVYAFGRLAGFCQ